MIEDLIIKEEERLLESDSWSVVVNAGELDPVTQKIAKTQKEYPRYTLGK
ncbi:hypothetical protein HC766_02700 [Candidatus Gracilibacteria bacterium]|nr:hypothetical protein [Candidatus Gracilibacteria bacterium]NJS41268.1 hypothetical protein [Candidatus Gracilibacteria bacterium]